MYGIIPSETIQQYKSTKKNMQSLTIHGCLDSILKIAVV